MKILGMPHAIRQVYCCAWNPVAVGEGAEVVATVVVLEELLEEISVEPWVHIRWLVLLQVDVEEELQPEVVEK